MNNNYNSTSHFKDIFLIRNIISLTSTIRVALVYQVLGESQTLAKLRATPLFENIISNKSEPD